MAKTISTEVFFYDELKSEQAKEKALNWMLEAGYHDDWWNNIYEDAQNIGLKIKSFDLDRNRNATGQFINGAQETANKIIAEHGKSCETYKTAKKFLAEFDRLNNMTDIDESLLQESEETFLAEILEDYSIILQKESEELSSREYLETMIKDNEYTFTAEGKRFG